MYVIGAIGALIIFSIMTIAVAMARRPRKVDIPDSDASRKEVQLLDQLKKAGDSLKLPRDVDFFLYFPGRENAEQAAEPLKADGFAVDVKPAATGDLWLCEAKRTIVPDLQVVISFRDYLTVIAARFGGEYDGWGSPVRRG